ncbi:radical SAM additional 4Fe4S-binding domain-containing protein [Lachnospiraceae bacterium JC7]|nr:radical SAM additional 4Fe4S-binding domain-containing protein [Lachnospiraceae bacterium JC7]
MEPKIPVRTAKEAGWKLSRYNLSMPSPGGEGYIIVNLFTGSFAVYSSLEVYLLSVFERLSEKHPAIRMFSERGLIVNYDELEAIETLSRLAMGINDSVSLTICPTMNCNFDCPYCFENHVPGKMSEKTQDDVIDLTRRMMKISRAKKLGVTWFGGEPLLAAEIIESLSKRLMALSEEYGADYRASIVTNGYFLNTENAEMLSRVKVETAQVTIDGIGDSHDRTRHLKNGMGSFDVITDNLRRPIPFPVSIRHNVSVDNYVEIEKLKNYVSELASESGNKLSYNTALVHESIVFGERGTDISLVEGDDAACIEARTRKISNGPLFCGAQHPFSVCIDEKGKLYKCWECIGHTEMSFGTAAEWNPADPVKSSEKPDLLTCFINSALSVRDDTCRNCKLYPHCLGGCPYQRIYMHNPCPSYKEKPEILLRSFYERMKSKDKTDSQEKI